MNIQSILDNLINGNLSDAKAGAKRASHLSIYNYCRSLGWSESLAMAAANYLKDKGSFQEWADKA